MRTDSVLCLIRDAKTGKVLYTPPSADPREKDDNRWLIREKSGLGRASKNEWHVLERVDEMFFERIDEIREWRFGFNDCYDVYIWDLVPGQNAKHFYGTIVTVSGYFSLPSECMLTKLDDVESAQML